MSYEDMARSHEEELLRTAFRFEQVLVDGVGELADHPGPPLAAVHGGTVTFPEDVDVSSEGGRG